MRVLSDGARRLINEMKKLRLSLIFNEQGCRRARARARERGYNGRRSPGPDVGGPRNITSPSRVAHLHAHGPGALGRLERIRSFGRIRVFSRCIFSAEGVFLRCHNTAGARGGSRFSFFDLAIVKYKRLERSTDSPPAHPGFV